MSWLAFWRRNRATEPRQSPAATSRTLGGRRFTRGVPYILPSDNEELNRLDFQHYMLRFAMRGNFAAPLGNPGSILDIACGTGRWAIEMATLFPQAHVIGTDITPPPETPGSPRPSNFTFLQSNMLEGIPFPDNSFDFVHQRLVIVALPTDRWVSQTRELLRVTRPGGWVELVEGDLLSGGPGLARLNALGVQLSQKRGMSFANAGRLDEVLRQAGARNVERRLVQIPVGQRAGRLGAMAETDYMAILTSMRGFLIGQGVISEPEHTRALAQAQAELASGRLTWPFYVAFGQK
ncbi:MAG TPA: class I SAM-dependent methyltransferase [Ktedonobacterales bacterium]